MATVDRVLPWRRHNEQNLLGHLTPVVESYRKHHPKSSTAMINRAYDVASEAHGTQMRSSGESYIHHPLAVAKIVAEFGLDDISLAAALLHDAVEDTELSLDDLRRDFGEDVAEIVDGVTKLDRLQFDSKEAQQAATMRKMLVAMAKDLRVLLIKLADRLHNMRTIASMSPERQHRIAQETLDIYAPLAHPFRNSRGSSAVRRSLLCGASSKTVCRIGPSRVRANPGARCLCGTSNCNRTNPFGRSWGSMRSNRTGQTPLEYLRKDGGQGSWTSMTFLTSWPSG